MALKLAADMDADDWWVVGNRCVVVMVAIALAVVVVLSIYPI